jgi:hypothetical protein
MTEAEWLACGQPDTLLNWLEYKSDHPPSRRKLAQVVAAWFRQIGRFVHDDLTLRALRILERAMEGPVVQSDLAEFRAELARRDQWYTPDTAQWVVRVLWPDEVGVSPEAVTRHVALRVSPYLGPIEQCGILRDVIANPFRTISLDPSWLSSTVLALAQGIYEDRAFDRLPILADAMQDAGCEDADILSHCCGPGPHVRGCWVVDLVLGKS